MKYRRLTEDGDYTFGNGSYDFASDDEAVGQAIKTKILLLKSEWWEDLNEGTDLFQGILLQNTDDKGKEAADIILRSRVLSLDEVDSILKWNSYINKSARTYSVEFTVQTIYGVINDEFTLGGQYD